MKTKKSILQKFESEKINQMQKITGGSGDYVIGQIYSGNNGGGSTSDYKYKYIGHGDFVNV
jgi:hypothetical protein